MKIPIGIICSFLGAVVLSYLALVTLIAFPSEGPSRWFAVGGIAGLSLIVGVLVNSGSIYVPVPAISQDSPLGRLMATYL